MTVIKLSDQDGQAAAFLADAEAEYREALEEFRAMRREIGSGQRLPETELRKAASGLRAAIQTVLAERKRIEELRRKELGIVHGYAIDFDAARREIVRRLDRLRAAVDADGLPGAGAG